MRFWITKNSELAVHHQLINQVMLGILSEDLPVGSKLPSSRELARRHRIHPNTVSSAYHELQERGWLELRPGNGLYVRPPLLSVDSASEMESLLRAVLNAGRSLGYEPDEVLERLSWMVRPSTCRRVMLAEPEAGMYQILRAEILEHVSLPVEPADENLRDFEDGLVVALKNRLPNLRRWLPANVPRLALRLRSVPDALTGQPRPGETALVAIVSRSAELRSWSRAMLIAVGLDPGCLCEVDSSDANWQERIATGTMVISDVISARHMPKNISPRVFRLIADSSMVELKKICG